MTLVSAVGAFAPAEAEEMVRLVKSALGVTVTDGRGRATSQRTAVLDALRATGRFRTAQDIYADLRSDGARIGLTTVYRHLQKLADEGAIHTVQTADRQTAYRLCGEGAHHHLVCIACGEGTEIADAELDRWAETQANRRGYSELSHRVEIFGLCPECRAAATTR